MSTTAKKSAAGTASDPGLRKRATSVLRTLRLTHPDATVALHHSNPLELLIATILSAQCTDERVNMVTGDLFRRYPTAAAYAAADRNELEGMIRSTGFYHAKANSLIKCCTALQERHSGSVPQSMEELVALPGVGRKTANVILGSAFNLAEGVVVDTHVARLSGRLGFSREKDAEKIERDLMALFPRKDWIDLGMVLILHGRRICKARTPDCPGCPVADRCPSSHLGAGSPRRKARHRR